MEKLWYGSGALDSGAAKLNSSIGFDHRLYRADVAGSIAHAQMLSSCGIITQEECAAIQDGLAEILDGLDSGRLTFDPECEDIHTFVETKLTSMIGDAGKKLHTARSRNDQVALDLRMYLRGEIDTIKSLIRSLTASVAAKAKEYSGVIMPGYTHLRRAQPILFPHHLAAYCFMFLRDLDRLNDCRKRVNVCPIGSCALAGTTYPTDRALEARILGFDEPCANSLDGVSDRDFCIELASVLSIVMVHLSRFAEELILWSSAEFGFVTLGAGFTTGSSIMPQKKNPDVAELVRGKSGRVFGDLTALLTVMKGLPLAYNKDMQEDKESIFDCCDTVKLCVSAFDGMISTLTANADAMNLAANEGLLNATDLADHMVGKGIPFRDAYKIAASIAEKCRREGRTLGDLSLDEYREFCPSLDESLYGAIDLAHCVDGRASLGGTSGASVELQLRQIDAALKANGG